MLENIIINLVLPLLIFLSTLFLLWLMLKGENKAKAISKENRLKSLESMLEKYEKGYKGGMCCLLFSSVLENGIVIKSRSEIMSYFPELLKRKPIVSRSDNYGYNPDDFWWDPDDSAIRIKVIKSAIEEIRKSL